MIIFETERLVVRQFTMNDANEFFRMNSDPEVMQYIRPVKNQQETDHFLQANIQLYQQQPLYGRWYAAEKSTGQFVGSFALIAIEGTDKMQIGYSLMPEFWGKGYATELTIEGLKYVFTKTSINIIYGVTEEPNTGSQNVLMKAGFKEDEVFMEGQKRLLRYMLEKEQWEKEQAEGYWK